jgi:hypothetical protein
LKTGAYAIWLSIAFLALHFLHFWSIFWAIFVFTLILQVLFDFLDQTCLRYSFEGFPTGFVIFGIFYEQ